MDNYNITCLRSNNTKQETSKSTKNEIAKFIITAEAMFFGNPEAAYWRTEDKMFLYKKDPLKCQSLKCEKERGFLGWYGSHHIY
ncbi:hypothetical protein E2C01_017298 [Portunus trituberculatus]|uniref:Uncharacterized protein n=1 Tax=Portunus trituberculatus TaxID=210409 RepID=A0A5B7DRJ2_PORTR|nr:hypothetical protein [Portunus trituberculatus]